MLFAGNPAILRSREHRTGGFASPPYDGFALALYWSKPHCNNACNLSEYADTFGSQLVFYLTTQIVALMTPLRALSAPVVE